MTTGAVASGSSGYVLAIDEVTAGTYVTPTEVLWATGLSNTDNAEQIRKQYFAGSRSAETGLGVGKLASAGQATFPLFPNVGMAWLKRAIGKDTYISALAADTTAGSVVTSAGLSTVTITTGGASIAPGQWLKIGAGANMEMRQVQAYNNSTKVLVVPALVTNAATGAGLAVTRVGQHQFSPLITSDSGYNTLQTASVCFNKGGLYDWRYAGCFAGQIAWAGDSNDITTTLDIVPTVAPVRNTPTSFSPSATEYADQSQYYTINHGFLTVPADPTASGTSTQQVHKTITGWGVTVNNTMVEKKYWDGGTHVKSYPTVQSVMGSYTYVNEAKRNSEYEDYIASSSSVLADVPIIVSLANNNGTAAAPTYQCVGFYVPNARIQNAPDTTTVADTQSVTVSWEADRPAGGDTLQVFVVNAKGTGY